MVCHVLSSYAFKNLNDNTCYNRPGFERQDEEKYSDRRRRRRFFGTHDGNIKYLESLLKVQVHIDGENNLTIDGEDTNVSSSNGWSQDYAQLRSEGVKFANGDLKSIIRIISEDASQSLRGVVSSVKNLQVGKRNVTPKTLNQKLYHRGDRKTRHGLRHRSRRYGKDLSRRQHGRSRI